jgi:YVTN family beta-propeller protein
MKHIKLNYLFIVLAAALVSSCHKDKQVPIVNTPTAQRAGIYILNQGGFNDNNSSLTYYNYTTKLITPDLFSSANGGAKLGDVGNDVEIYGSKMYIVVNNSNKVDIVNAKTGVLIKSDSLYQCRSVVFYGSNAFITSYNGTVSVLDTVSLTIKNAITVGPDPEQMVIVGSKLYVANSGGLNPNPNNTVSVIDLATQTQTKQITVIANPVSVTADTLGHVYVLSLGNFADLNPGMTIIDDVNDVELSEPAVSLGYNVPVYAQHGFIYYPTANNDIAVFNAKTQSVASVNFITDGTVITAPYAVSGDPATGEIFVADAVDYQSNGILYAFDKTGKKEYQLTVGIDPGKIALLNK